MKKIHKQGRQL